MTDEPKVMIPGTKAGRALWSSVLAATPYIAFLAYSLLSGDDHSWGILIGTFICLPASALLSLVALISSVLVVKSEGSNKTVAYAAVIVSLVTLLLISAHLLRFLR